MPYNKYTVQTDTHRITRFKDTPGHGVGMMVNSADGTCKQGNVTFDVHQCTHIGTTTFYIRSTMDVAPNQELLVHTYGAAYLNEVAIAEGHN